MNGAFKGLKQSDVYLTSYVSKRGWNAAGSGFQNLGISEIKAISGSLPYVSLGEVASRHQWEPVASYSDYRIYRRLKAAGEPDDYIRNAVLVQYSGSSHDADWENLISWSGGYFPELAYRGLDISYYTGSLPDIGSFSGSYDLSLQTTLTTQGGRRLPTNIIAYSIPRTCFGENIEEGSLTVDMENDRSRIVLQDKEGLLFEEEDGRELLFSTSIALREIDYVKEGTSYPVSIFSGSILEGDEVRMSFLNADPQWCLSSSSLNGRVPLEVSSSAGTLTYTSSVSAPILEMEIPPVPNETYEVTGYTTNRQYPGVESISYTIQNQITVPVQNSREIYRHVGRRDALEGILFSGSSYQPNLSSLETAGNPVLQVGGAPIDPEWLCSGILLDRDPNLRIDILAVKPDPDNLVSLSSISSSNPVDSGSVPNLVLTPTGSGGTIYLTGTGSIKLAGGDHYWTVKLIDLIREWEDLPEGINIFRVVEETDQGERTIFSIDSFEQVSATKMVQPGFSLSGTKEYYIELNLPGTSQITVPISRCFTEHVLRSSSSVHLPVESSMGCRYLKRDLFLESGKDYTLNLDWNYCISESGDLYPNTWPACRLISYSGSQSQSLFEVPNPFTGSKIQGIVTGQAEADYYSLELYVTGSWTGSLMTTVEAPSEIQISNLVLDPVYETEIHRDTIRPGATYSLSFPEAETWFTGSDNLLNYSPIQINANFTEYNLYETGSFELQNTETEPQKYRVKFRTGVNSGTVQYARQNLSPKKSVVGDIIYDQGLVLLDGNMVGGSGSIQNLGWTSRKTINTWNVRCMVKDLEYNYTYNPTVSNELKPLMGTSEFTPYITSIGLYNRAGELMAVAKLSKPVRKFDNIDMTFKVNIDVS